MWKRQGSNGAGYKPSGKVYESHFYNAIQRYGWDNFEHIILIDNITLELAEIIERELINKYNTTDEQYGYNRALGGIGGSGGYKKLISMIQMVIILKLGIVFQMLDTL